MSGGVGAPHLGARASGGSVACIMDLGFRDQVIDGIPVLELNGDADQATLPRLVDRVNRLAVDERPAVGRQDRFAAEHRYRLVVIDLDGLATLEPVTMGAFISARLILRSGGGDLEVVCNVPALTALFTRSGLDATFTPHATIAAARGR